MADEEEQPTVNYRVSGGIQPSLYVMAFIFDILSFIPFGNTITLFIGQAMVAGMFALLKVNVIDKRNWLWYAATWIGELIWPISVLPMFLFSTWRMIFISRRQDEINASAKGSMLRKGAAAVAKSQYARNRMRGDRQKESEADKKRSEEPAGSRGRKYDEARQSKDVFKGPREQRAANQQDNAGGTDPNSGIFNKISNYADRQPAFRQKNNQEKPALPANDNEDGAREAA